MKKHEDQSTTTTTVISETRGMTAEEERLLRMHAGASLAPDAALGSKLDGVADAFRDDVVARLRLIEAEALAAITGQDAAAGLEPGTKKSRIIAALRDKPED